MITVSIRKEDGSIINMNRTSNSYNYYLFFTPKFSQHQFESAIDAYVSCMIKDKESFTSLSPKNRGIVFIDFKDKEIHSIQNYDYPGTLLLADLFSPDINEIPHHHYIKKLYHDDKLFFCHPYRKEYIPLKKYLQQAEELPALKALQADSKEIPIRNTMLYLDSFTDNILKDWSIRSYKINTPNDTIPTLANFFKLLRLKNIKLTHAELYEWREYLIANNKKLATKPYPQDYIHKIFSTAINRHVAKPSKIYTNPMGM